MRTLGLILLSIFSAAAFATEGPRARAAYNLQDAKTYSGSTTNLGLGYVTPSRWNLGLNADLLTRAYRGGATVRDDQFGATVSRPLDEHVYVDAAATAASTANIYARWSALVTPHFVTHGTDFGLGLKYAEYKLSRVGGFNPTVFHYFRNGLAIGAGTYVIRTENYITSYSAQALYVPNEHHAVRVGGGLGRALEDAGLEANFNVLSAEYTYTCAAGFSVGLGLTDYWSQVRRERTVGFRLGWR